MDFHASARAVYVPRPGGRCTWMCAGFRPRQDAESETSRVATCVVSAPSGKGLSLVAFFGPTKKVTRPKAEAVAVVLAVLAVLAVLVVRYGTSEIKCVRLKEGHFSLLSAKRSNQKKWPSPTGPPLARRALCGFSDSASCLGRKTACIHARSPSDQGTWPADTGQGSRATALQRPRQRQSQPQPQPTIPATSPSPPTPRSVPAPASRRPAAVPPTAARQCPTTSRTPSAPGSGSAATAASAGQA